MAYSEKNWKTVYMHIFTKIDARCAMQTECLSLFSSKVFILISFQNEDINVFSLEHLEDIRAFNNVNSLYVIIIS